MVTVGYNSSDHVQINCQLRDSVHGVTAPDTTCTAYAAPDTTLYSAQRELRHCWALAGAATSAAYVVASLYTDTAAYDVVTVLDGNWRNRSVGVKMTTLQRHSTTNRSWCFSTRDGHAVAACKLLKRVDERC